MPQNTYQSNLGPVAYLTWASCSVYEYVKFVVAPLPTTDEWAEPVIFFFLLLPGRLSLSSSDSPLPLPLAHQRDHAWICGAAAARFGRYRLCQASATAPWPIRRGSAPRNLPPATEQPRCGPSVAAPQRGSAASTPMSLPPTQHRGIIPSPLRIARYNCSTEIGHRRCGASTSRLCE
jgi:hypothetical protein